MPMIYFAVSTAPGSVPPPARGVPRRAAVRDDHATLVSYEGDNYAAVRLRRWLRFKHKTRRSKDGSYPLSHLYETFGLVRLTRLGHDVPWTKA
jgi:hypothetical protein